MRCMLRQLRDMIYELHAYSSIYTHMLPSNRVVGDTHGVKWHYNCLDWRVSPTPTHRDTQWDNQGTILTSMIAWQVCDRFETYSLCLQWMPPFQPSWQCQNHVGLLPKSTLTNSFSRKGKQKLISPLLQEK